MIRLVLLVAKVPKTIQDSKTRYRMYSSKYSFRPAQTVAVLKTLICFSFLKQYCITNETY